MSESRGRPPKKATERKTAELRIRLTEAERRALEKAAGDEGTSTWARDLLLRAAKPRRKK